MYANLTASLSLHIPKVELFMQCLNYSGLLMPLLTARAEFVHQILLQALPLSFYAVFDKSLNTLFVLKHDQIHNSFD